MRIATIGGGYVGLVSDVRFPEVATDMETDQ